MFVHVHSQITNTNAPLNNSSTSKGLDLRLSERSNKLGNII